MIELRYDLGENFHHTIPRVSSAIDGHRGRMMSRRGFRPRAIRGGAPTVLTAAASVRRNTPKGAQRDRPQVLAQSCDLPTLSPRPHFACNVHFVSKDSERPDPAALRDRLSGDANATLYSLPRRERTAPAGPDKRLGSIKGIFAGRRPVFASCAGIVSGGTKDAAVSYGDSSARARPSSARASCAPSRPT